MEALTVMARAALLTETPAFSGLVPPMSVQTPPLPSGAIGWKSSYPRKLAPFAIAREEPATLPPLLPALRPMVALAPLVQAMVTDPVLVAAAVALATTGS